jgi:hypothetical protein
MKKIIKDTSLTGFPNKTKKAIKEAKKKGHKKVITKGGTIIEATLLSDGKIKLWIYSKEDPKGIEIIYEETN